ncbi:hypothetical protein Pint_23165 [Pistacia integerrima]|uniref:Uncharacterized protein n=1 Tax=Pistacia integerrima TaxID=434235 RepID=A0ACC0YHS3_9ROSI|nr:hypothetical protein Pint_23165 [Pistacia integerrima]
MPQITGFKVCTHFDLLQMKSLCLWNQILHFYAKITKPWGEGIESHYATLLNGDFAVFSGGPNIIQWTPMVSLPPATPTPLRHATLDFDGHLIIYDLVESIWTKAEILTVNSCDYPLARGSYGICLNSGKKKDGDDLEEDYLDKAEEHQLVDMIDKNSEVMISNEAEVMETMKVAAWCLQSDFSKRPFMSVVVTVLEGLVEVEENLEFKPK